MNLKILFVILIYWGFFFLISNIAGGILLQDEGYTTTSVFNESAITEGELPTDVSVINAGEVLGRYVDVIDGRFNIGDDAPEWFQLMFAVWQSIWILFTIGFFISAVWNG